MCLLLLLLRFKSTSPIASFTLTLTLTALLATCAAAHSLFYAHSGGWVLETKLRRPRKRRAMEADVVANSGSGAPLTEEEPTIEEPTNSDSYEIICFSPSAAPLGFSFSAFA
jgi:hypothetical protein